MSKIQQLRSFFNQRLAAAAEEIFGVVEKTITEYQDELSRSEEKNTCLQNLLDVAVRPEIKLYRTDAEQRLQPPLCDEVPPEQQLPEQEWRPRVGQGGPKNIYIKEELEEIRTSLGEEREPETSECLFTSPRLLRACDPEPPLPSHGHQTQSKSITYEQFKTEAEEDHASQVLSQPLPPVESTYQRSPAKSCCKVCGKTFLKKTYFFKHVRMHTKIRERVCGVCGEQLELEAIKDHVQAHIDAQFTCHVCGKCFVNNSALSLHMRVHTGEKPYRCAVCGRAFAGLTNLANHKRSHTGEKPYTCTVCGKGFSVSCNLTQHMMIHTGERPYHCPHCQKGFITMVRLRRHQIAVHAQGETFFCNDCGNGYKSMQALKWHSTVHRETGFKMVP